MKLKLPLTEARIGRSIELLQEAVDSWPSFDHPYEQVSGADLVDWFYEWRERVKELMGHA